MRNSKETVLVVAPHPDDETLGCGGTLLRHSADADERHWLIATTIEGSEMFSSDRIASGKEEIANVAENYGFEQIHLPKFPTTRLDTIAKGDLIAEFSEVVQRVRPTTVYLPFRNDVHSDHAAVFDAMVAATKSFRAPFVKGIYAYETLSETEFGLRTDDSGFQPNLFIDISEHLNRKIEIMKLFKEEMDEFPFPRSATAITAQAQLRGSQIACHAAEAFMILKEIR